MDSNTASVIHKVVEILALVLPSLLAGWHMPQPSWVKPAIDTADAVVTATTKPDSNGVKW